MVKHIKRPFIIILYILHIKLALNHYHNTKIFFPYLKNIWEFQYTSQLQCQQQKHEHALIVAYGYDTEVKTQTLRLAMICFHSNVCEIILSISYSNNPGKIHENDSART